MPVTHLYTSSRIVSLIGHFGDFLLLRMLDSVFVSMFVSHAA